jgi:dihydrofolate reductase
MRKIILDLAVTLDGFIEGPNGEIDWLDPGGNTDFGDILQEILVDIDAIFYGRISYELWGNYQPEASESAKTKAAYELLHSKTKYVFSSSKKGDETDAIFIGGDIQEEVQKILSQAGKNIWLYGGGKLVTTFMNLGLIDVFRLAVHPVILGSGKPLFHDIRQRTDLRLSSVKTSEAGVVFMVYEAVK